jgi:hypothetical protein
MARMDRCSPECLPAPLGTSPARPGPSPLTLCPKPTKTPQRHRRGAPTAPGSQQELGLAAGGAAGPRRAARQTDRPHSETVRPGRGINRDHPPRQMREGREAARRAFPATGKRHAQSSADVTSKWRARNIAPSPGTGKRDIQWDVPSLSERKRCEIGGRALRPNEADRKSLFSPAFELLFPVLCSWRMTCQTKSRLRRIPFPRTSS